MIIPRYWAESRLQEQISGRQVTVRRFGWSNESQEQAEAHAAERAGEALNRIRSGERLANREPKVPYNGADGLPIREEILATHGETIITRNSYGAQCLNTPNVMFIDIDTAYVSPIIPCLGTFTILVSVIALAYSLIIQNWNLSLIIVAVLGALITVFTILHQVQLHRTGDQSYTYVKARLDAFLDTRPDWRFRVYRTPNGYRLLAMHALFDPRGQQAQEAFDGLGADPTYVLMCKNQNCFRARVSPKPWRIGIPDHLRPRPGVWPINPERLPERLEWIERYEEKAEAFSSCQFIEELGMGSTSSSVVQVQKLHDELSRANRSLPMG